MRRLPPRRRPAAQRAAASAGRLKGLRLAAPRRAGLPGRTAARLWRLARLAGGALPALTLVLALAGQAAAGAWTLAPGTGQAIVTMSWTEADRAFDSGGRLRRGGAYSKAELSAFVEWGVAEGLTAIAQTTLQSKTVSAPVRDSRTGLDYTEIGLRKRLAEGGWGVASVQGSLRLPGATDGRAPAEIGSTDPEADGRLLWGRGWSAFGRTGWADLQAGLRLRGGSPPNEGRFDVTLGVRPAEGWMLIGQGFVVVADGTGAPGFPKERSLKLQLSAAREVAPGWTLQAGAVTTVWGREAAQEAGLFAAVWRRF